MKKIVLAVVLLMCIFFHHAKAEDSSIVISVASMVCIYGCLYCITVCYESYYRNQAINQTTQQIGATASVEQQQEAKKGQCLATNDEARLVVVGKPFFIGAEYANQQALCRELEKRLHNCEASHLNDNPFL